MTFEGMYEIFRYLKRHNIKLSKDLRNLIASLDQIDATEYIVLEYRVDVIKTYFYEVMMSELGFEELITFLNNVVDQNLTDEELMHCIHLIASQNEDPNQILVRKACENKEIRENKELLDLIASKDEWYEQKEIIEEFERKKEYKEYTDEIIQMTQEILEENSEDIDSFIKTYEDLDPKLRNTLSTKNLKDK